MLIQIQRISQHKVVRQGTKYIIVGGVCTLADIAVLYFLTRYIGINYLISSILSFSVGVVINYFFCVMWIFDFRTIQNRTHEFLCYLAISLVALGINTFVIWVLTAFFAFYFLISKIFASIITLIYNFLIRKYFLHTIR